jgi:sugar phosphate isomerase/epimerase
MYVACSTLCFNRYPLDQALRTISELRFGKADVALHEDGPHLKPSEVAADVPRAAQLLRGAGFSFCVGALHTLIQATGAEHDRQLRACCRLGRLMAAAVVTIPAAPLKTPLAAEVARLTGLVNIARSEGVLLTVETHSQTLTADPAVAVQLCQRVPGLGLTLDPSHYVIAKHHADNFDEVYPYVRHVRLRDTSAKPGAFQVKIGQGQIEYGQIVAHLSRCKYDRLLSVDIRADVGPNQTLMEPEVRKLKFLLESLV